MYDWEFCMQSVHVSSSLVEARILKIKWFWFRSKHTEETNCQTVG